MARPWFFALTCLSTEAVEITVDYRFDSAGFFDDPARRLVMEAAASRWSRIVDQGLLPVNMVDGELSLTGTSNDGRFQIKHPETNQSYIFSAAASASSDFFVTQFGVTQQVDEYLDGFSLNANEMIVFVGSRPISNQPGQGNVLGGGGAIRGGGNPQFYFEDPNSFLNRGFHDEPGTGSLNVIGGFISFDSAREWNFDLSSVRGRNDAVDFYSVAIHELGHIFGLNSSGVTEWIELVNGNNQYTGQSAVNAYNSDNGTNLTALELFDVPNGDYHWEEGLYTSRIFPFGTPLLIGTVGSSLRQELLMEAAYSPDSGRRLEVTNVDAASLIDLGWSLIASDPPRPPVLPVEILPSPQGGLGVSIDSQVGVVYTIQTSPDGASWVDVFPPLIGDGGPLSWTDGQEGSTDAFGPAANLSGKYYRVIQKN